VSKQLTTDTSIRKWKVARDSDTYSCGNRSGLYIRGYSNQKKAFYWRSDTWIKLGDYPSLTLAEARELVSFCKRGRKQGKSVKAIQVALAASSYADDFLENLNKTSTIVTFENITYEDVFTAWYNAKSAKLWQSGPSRRRPKAMHKHWVPATLKEKPISVITRQDIFSFLDKMFDEAYDSAGKQLGYMRRVFEFAINSGYANTNPVPPRGAFENVAPNKKPHGYLEYERMPELWNWIKGRTLSAHTKLAMNTVMLTGHRISVVVQARWDHINLATRVWTVPHRANNDKETSGAMKSGREFRITLPEPFFEELLKIRANSPFLFPSPTTQGHVTPNATLKAFKRFENKITNHGFRNSIKTWGRHEGFPDYLMDAYVDHGLTGLDKSYRREDLTVKIEKITQKLFDFLENNVE
jgi:integrase